MQQLDRRTDSLLQRLDDIQEQIKKEEDESLKIRTNLTIAQRKLDDERSFENKREGTLEELRRQKTQHEDDFRRLQNEKKEATQRQADLERKMEELGNWVKNEFRDLDLSQRWRSFSCKAVQPVAIPISGHTPGHESTGKIESTAREGEAKSETAPAQRELDRWRD